MRTRHTIARTVLNSMPDFIAGPDYIVARFHIGNNTFGVRFVSPEHLLEFHQALMEKACEVWPDNEWIKEYLREE